MWSQVTARCEQAESSPLKVPDHCCPTKRMCEALRTIAIRSLRQKMSFVMERAKLLEAWFAISHPTVERFMREVIDTLAKIGV